MASWEGTSLSAVFLAPPWFWTAVPDLFRLWRDSGLLETGRARWRDLLPAQATYETIMTLLPDHETQWRDGSEDLAEYARHYTFLGLEFPFSWAHGAGESRIALVFFKDNSVSVYFDAPYSDVYEEQPPSVRRDNLSRFVDAACLLFHPSVFVTGAIGEEAQFSGLAALLSDAEQPLAWAFEGLLPDDWAFYGAELTRYLAPALTPDLRRSAREVRDLPGGGLFVRWTEWDDPPGGPPAWRTALAEARRRLRADLLQV